MMPKIILLRGCSMSPAMFFSILLIWTTLHGNKNADNRRLHPCALVKRFIVESWEFISLCCNNSLTLVGTFCTIFWSMAERIFSHQRHKMSVNSKPSGIYFDHWWQLFSDWFRLTMLVEACLFLANHKHSVRPAKSDPCEFFLVSRKHHDCWCHFVWYLYLMQHATFCMHMNLF